jgi:hypothetical protein
MNAVITVDRATVVLGVFGEPDYVGPALAGIVTDENGHGRSFRSPAHLAHDVINGLRTKGYNPAVVDSDDVRVRGDYEYDLSVAPNGQALVRVFDQHGTNLIYNGRVKELAPSFV